MNWLTMNKLITQFYSNATYFLLINLYMFIGHQKTIVEKNNEQINKFSQTYYTLTFGNKFLSGHIKIGFRISKSTINLHRNP